MLTLISINYIISGYSIGFDAHGIFALLDGNGFGKNVIIFGADMHLLVDIDSKKYVFILGKAPIDGLNDTTWLQRKNIV